MTRAEAARFLKLPVTATPEEVHRQYRKLIPQYHPDRNQDNPDAPRLFRQLTEAYNIMKEPSRERARPQAQRREVNTRARGFHRPIFDPNSEEGKKIIEIGKTLLGDEVVEQGQKVVDSFQQTVQQGRFLWDLMGGRPAGKKKG